MTAFAFSIDQVMDQVVKYYWPLVRVSGVLSVAPVIGSPQIPVRIRAMLALLLTLAILPLTGPLPEVDPFSLEGVIVTISQLIIGLIMGFTLLIVFNVLSIAGEAIAAAMGLGFALLADPTSGVQIPVVSQFFAIIATLLFLALDGHHALISMLATSFTLIPVGQTLNPQGFWEIINWSSILFAGAVMVALPALIAMLSINLVMGVMTRAAPQLNIFSVGFPVTMTLGFIVILLTLPGLSPGFEKLLVDGYETMVNSLRAFTQP